MIAVADAHCHLEDEAFATSLPQVVEAAEQAGVCLMVTAAVIPEQWEKSLSIAKTYSSVKCALGIHPWFVKSAYADDISRLAETCARGAAAVGEIGLDRQTGSLEEQIPFFEEQLALARDEGLPVVVHCRSAFDALYASVKRIGLPETGGVIHAFNGSPELAEQFARLGFSFSLGGALTFRDSRRRAEMLRRIYPTRFLLETDSPAIPPAETQGKTNTPANILYSLQAASEIIGLPIEEVARTALENTERIFGCAKNN